MKYEGKTDVHEMSILGLENGEMYLWPESDYGRAEIYRINNVYILFSIPQYGGEPAFYETVPTASIAYKIVNAWTYGRQGHE